MKGWESQLPPTFPIGRLHDEAVRQGEERKRRRVRRYQHAVTGLCAVLIAGVVVAVAGRDDPGEQVQAGQTLDGAFPITASNGKIAFLRSAGPIDPPASGS